MSDTKHFDVQIEISANSNPVKYEMDKASDCLRVDRIMPTSMQYPCNYGFIPNTLGGDGDPIDVLVYSSYALLPGSLIKSRAIGVLRTEDESGVDEKILALPAAKIDPFLKEITDIEHISTIFKQKVVHFFENYKALEAGKWVKVLNWENAQVAYDIIKI